LGVIDILGTAAARMSGIRNDYTVAPGLYCVGSADPNSPVLVTANYKMSFDALRKELGGLGAWLLVLDTRGINVWCAAGKELFSTDEVVRMVTVSGLERVVQHRRLILPQLSSTGVSAHGVRQRCGFEVVWGPVKARDLIRFLEAGMKADTPMRRVTFTLPERLVLVPIEFSMAKRPALWIILTIFLLSGIGPQVFSLSVSWNRGIIGTAALIAGILTGAVIAPVFLPWLPWRAFAAKGALTGLFGGTAVVLLWWGKAGALDSSGALLIAIAVSSYLSMSFTGSTPFTSPSGVEKEMRKAIPLQAAALFTATLVWVGSAFLR
jgi:hypothetical protein